MCLLPGMLVAGLAEILSERVQTPTPDPATLTFTFTNQSVSPGLSPDMVAIDLAPRTPQPPNSAITSTNRVATGRRNVQFTIPTQANITLGDCS